MISIPIFGDISLKLPPYALFISDTLHSAGFEAYAVGGCVRDSLLGRCVNDWDITTSAAPEVTLGLFSSGEFMGMKIRCIPTGIAHGTVTVAVGDSCAEVTTFRVDGSYADGRHPQSVRFTGSLEEDLRRRDFTVNAIAYDPARGIVDPLGGREDLEKGLLRAVGDAQRRFGEDALRIMRALRFSSSLGFEIEPQTARAIHELGDRLALVSRERICAEFLKLLCGDGAARVIAQYPDVVGKAIGVKLPTDGYQPLEHISEPKLRPAAFFLCAGIEASKADDIMRGLRFDNATRSFTHAVIEESCCDFSDITALNALIIRRGYAFAEELLSVAAAFGRDITFARGYIGDMRGSGIPCSISGLALGGTELGRIGLRGRVIGDALNIALAAIVKREITNNAQDIIDYIKTEIKRERIMR